MSAPDWVFVFGALFAMIAVAALYRAWWLEGQLDDQKQQTQQLEDKARVILAAGPKYQIKVADWGPDFTGKDDILPRWRWSVVDAQHVWRLAFDPVYDARRTSVVMIGNETTKEAALLAAAQWIERQEHPMVTVEGAEI